MKVGYSTPKKKPFKLKDHVQVSPTHLTPTLVKKTDILSSFNCKITEITSSPEQKSVVTSLKKVSASLMTCQKLYASCFACHEKEEIEMFDLIMKLKSPEQFTSEKNVDLETQVAKLNCDVGKLHFQLRQKNTHEPSLRQMYPAEKKELNALQNVRVLKLEKELMQLKKEKAERTNSTRLENNKLKENAKSMKTLHQDQLRMKDARISVQNSTVKSLRAKLKTVKKSQANLQAKLFNFQQ